MKRELRLCALIAGETDVIVLASSASKFFMALVNEGADGRAIRNAAHRVRLYCYSNSISSTSFFSFRFFRSLVTVIPR